MASLEFIDLKKSYRDTEIIHGINASIEAGEFIVIVGPSGCGKSTLLRMTAGLESITSGQVRIADRVVNDLEPKDRNIAMVFQNYALYPHMNLFDNMAYGLKIRHIPKQEIAQRVNEVAKILELKDLLDRKPSQISGGQRQRVAMGRAIVRKPSLFLFDEPLSNLDAKLRVQMRLELKQMHQRIRTTSLYVTHDQVEAMTLADRMIVMKDGHAEQIGAPLEVYANPDTRFVAGFIGSPSMNFLEATVDEQAQFVVINNGSGRIPLNIVLQPGQAVTVGLRPEHMTLSSQETADCHGQLQLVEMLGADSLLHIDAAGQDFIVRCHGIQQLAIGDIVHVKANPAYLYFFDANTGLRLR